MADRISVDRVDEMMRLVFAQLKAIGGRARGSDVLAAIEPKLKLTDYEREKTSTGAVRWDTHVRFYSSDCVRAGYLKKSDGYWTLTEQGEKALRLPAGQLIRTAGQKYRAWKKSQTNQNGDPGISVDPGEKAVRQATYEQAQEKARAEIDDHLEKMDPYDFQRVVSELLRAMGYHLAFEAAPGPDGGVDIVAYKDPLGTAAPRIKVQVKHRINQKVDVKEVRELEGLLRKDGDVGLIVSAAGFTSEAEREIRLSTKHIEQMDQDRLIALWQEHYGKLSQPGKALMPLVNVSFLAPADE